MPYEIRKVGAHYMVRNTDTGQVFAKHTSAVKAIRQVNLLRVGLKERLARL